MVIVSLVFRSKAFGRFLHGTDFPLSEPSGTTKALPSATATPSRDPRFRDLRVWRTEETKRTPAVVKTEIESSEGILRCESRWVRRCEESIDGVDKFGCADFLPSRSCSAGRSVLNCENEAQERAGTRFIKCTREATLGEQDMTYAQDCRGRSRAKRVVFVGTPFRPITSTEELLRVFPIRSESDADFYVRNFFDLESGPFAAPLNDWSTNTNGRKRGVKVDAAAQPVPQSFEVWIHHARQCSCNHDTMSINLRVSSDGSVRRVGENLVQASPNHLCVD